MQKLEIKAVVQAKDFDLTPQELQGLARKSCPGGRLAWAYARLMERDPDLAREWTLLVSACDLAAYCNGIRRGVQIAAQALPLGADARLEVEVTVR